MTNISMTCLLVFMVSGFYICAQNQSINFDDQQGTYILVPDNPALNVSDNFTIEMWIMPDKILNWGVLLQEGKCSNSSYSYTLSIHADSTLHFGFNNNGNCNYTNSYTCDTKITPGSCLHVALSYSAAGVQVWFNGVLQPGHYVTGSYCGALAGNSEPLRIASYRFLDESIGSFYDGMIDELRIWGRVLSGTEIQNQYMDTLAGNETDLILYCRFDSIFSGPGVTIRNYASATGSALNGTTYSNNSVTPSTSYACFLYTGKENEENNRGLKIYPVPAGDCLIIETGNMDSGKIEIWSSGGMMTRRVENAAFPYRLDSGQLPAGVYFLKIYGDEKTPLTGKFLVR
ncbi:MAG: LamG-like jellyroll fold domain-containing protein [Bacteroidota bacterium]